MAVVQGMQKGPRSWVLDALFPLSEPNFLTKSDNKKQSFIFVLGGCMWSPSFSWIWYALFKHTSIGDFRNVFKFHAYPVNNRLFLMTASMTFVSKVFKLMDFFPAIKSLVISHSIHLLLSM